MRKVLVFRGWLDYPSRYERDQKAVIITPADPNVVAFTNDFDAGGVSVPFGGLFTTLTLTFDGQPVATKTVVAGNTGVTFTVNLTDIAEGWYMAGVNGLDPSWTVIDYPIYVLKGATAQPQTKVPVTTGSHTLVFTDPPVYQRAMMPAVFDPVRVPYTPRAWPPFTAKAERQNLIVTSLVPARPGDGTRPLVTKEGIWTSANRQNYFYFDFEQGTPMLPMLDGPRGVGSCISPAFMEIGKAAPASTGPIGNTYFIESWRLCKCRADGTVVTLAGWRHKSMASYRKDPTTLELVGDWSRIPPERRGFAQPWGLAWDERSLLIDENAAPIPTERNLKPHLGAGPVAWISDTFHHRIVKLQFSSVSHATPPVVTEFVPPGTLKEPWACVAIPGTRELVVSDRKNNRLCVFHQDSAALLYTIPATQPEGLDFQDGWLYYASVITKSIRKLEWATSTLPVRNDVLVADPTFPASVKDAAGNIIKNGSNLGYWINDNSRYFHFALSDGTFMARGSIAFATWSNIYFGYPVLLDNEGRWVDYVEDHQKRPFRGVPKPPGLTSYNSSVALGQGRMVFSSAEEGLHVVSQALPTDPVCDVTKYNTGAQQYKEHGYALTHGPAGYGYYGLPLPWNITPEIDYYLTMNGHVSSV